MRRLKRLYPKPDGYRPILTTASPKTMKGEKYGHLTAILYLAPAMESGVMNTCSYSTVDCEKACLYRSGHGAFTFTQNVRIAKTRLLHENRALFLACLRYDIASMIRQARRRRMKLAIRINGTSDLPWISMQMAAEFPAVQFYDYTKIPRPYQRTRANYAITFSYSGENLPATLDALANGINVAVVFNTRKGQPLPETWQGYKVIDGDLHDLRFRDEQGVVVGLRAKGPAIKQTSPFIVLA